jgi:hypothetical protein
VAPKTIAVASPQPNITNLLPCLKSERAGGNLSISEIAERTVPANPLAPPIKILGHQSVSLFCQVFCFSVASLPLINSINHSNLRKTLIINQTYDLALKLSKCSGFNSKIKEAWNICEQKGLLKALADLSVEWKDIVKNVKYLCGVDNGRIPVKDYLFALTAVIERSSERRLKQAIQDLDETQRLGYPAVTLCLYQLMEVNIREKSEDGRL